MASTNSPELDVRRWTLRTLYGWLMGFIVVVVLAILSDFIGISSQFFVGTGMAAGVGFMQVRILRKDYGWNWNWMWASIVGTSISFILFDLGSGTWNLLEFNLPLSVVIGSLIVGFLQSRILKSKSLKFYQYWILISCIGWSLTGTMVILSDYLNQILPKGPGSVFPFLLLVIIISGVLLGWVTGKGLSIIFNWNQVSQL